MAGLQLFIANKNYSSWSLRAWLFMKRSGIPFEERRIPLYTREWEEGVGGVSPSGRLPALRDGDLVVWDSWAIMEHLRSARAGAVGWPSGEAARAVALSVSAEMHSGFLALRDEMPFNCRKRLPGVRFSEAAAEEADRVRQIWQGCRERFGGGGAWLFGGFSQADVMYAPVVLRFRTYGIALKGAARAYADSVLGLPEIQEWVHDAEAEPEVLEDYERAPG